MSRIDRFFQHCEGALKQHPTANDSSQTPLSNIVLLDMRFTDVRFPTSEGLHGSDAMHPDPDYSAVYVTIDTNVPHLQGHGLTFTLGRGNEVVTAAVAALKHLVIGKSLGDITAKFAEFWRTLVSDGQLRWLGPEKGVIHMAVGAVVNAIWDLWAKAEKKPLWRLLSEMPPKQLVNCIDFRWITDVITPDEAVKMLEAKARTKANRINDLTHNGYPAYTTSAGWLGYTEQQLRTLCRQGVAAGWTHFKVKVGQSVEEDKQRLRIIREEIGYERKMMVDANQRWDVQQAVDYMKALAQFKPWFIEEPTSPDDVLGHAAIRKALKPLGIKVATGEVCANRVMFKQLLQGGAIDFCQIDSCRIGGVNEILAVILMAAKFKVPVFPHAGGVGLCEYVQHLAMWDYVSVSGEYGIIEFVDHLHEHFEYPVKMRNGRYVAPTEPGYSITMKPASLRDYTFPSGQEWTKRTASKQQRVAAEHRALIGPSKEVWLITGAQGFFGAWIIRKLLDRPNVHVVAFDLRPDDGIYRQVFRDAERDLKRFTRVYGDVGDAATVTRIITEYSPKHIIHLAGLQVPTCRVNPSAGAAVNVVGTVNVFSAAAALKPVPNIVYASSAAVCGPPDDYKGPVNDHDAHRPRTQYGVFKLCNEGNARIFWQDHKVPSVGLRPLTVFGVGREVGMTSSPTKAVKAAILGRKSYEVTFSGLTAFNDVEDVADLFIICAEKCREGAHACNIKGVQCSVKEFMETAEKAVPELKGRYTFQPNAPALPFPSDYNESALEGLIGHVPVTPLEDSLRRTADHFRALATAGRLNDKDL